MNKQTIRTIIDFNLKKNFLPLVLYYTLGFLISMLFVFLVTTLDSDIETYVNFSGLLLFILFILSVLFNGMISFSTDFNNIISLGTTRKNFLAGTFIYYLIYILVSLLTIYLFMNLEKVINIAIYSSRLKLDEEFMNIAGSSIFLYLAVFSATAVIFLLFSFFLAAILVRFGNVVLSISFLSIGLVFIIAVEVMNYLKAEGTTIEILSYIANTNNIFKTGLLVFISILMVLFSFRVFLKWDVK